MSKESWDSSATDASFNESDRWNQEETPRNSPQFQVTFQTDDIGRDDGAVLGGHIQPVDASLWRQRNHSSLNPPIP